MYHSFLCRGRQYLNGPDMPLMLVYRQELKHIEPWNETYLGDEGFSLSFQNVWLILLFDLSQT